jgi:protein-tyrosine-phosphatase
MTLERRATQFAALGDIHRLAIVDALGHTDLTPGDLAAITGAPTNLLAHHLGILEDAGLIVRTRSEGDARRRYVTLAAGARSLAGEAIAEPTGSVAFVCTHNSARSQFAAARFRQLTGTDAASAGTHPAAAVHPGAITAAARYGLDLSGGHPASYETLEALDIVVSVCDRALEYGLPTHRRHLHWSIADPTPRAARSDFDAAFAGIDGRLRHLVDQWPQTAMASRSKGQLT